MVVWKLIHVYLFTEKWRNVVQKTAYHYLIIIVPISWSNCFQKWMERMVAETHVYCIIRFPLIEVIIHLARKPFSSFLKKVLYLFYFKRWLELSYAFNNMPFGSIIMIHKNVQVDQFHFFWHQLLQIINVLMMYVSSQTSYKLACIRFSFTIFIVLCYKSCCTMKHVIYTLEWLNAASFRLLPSKEYQISQCNMICNRGSDIGAKNT